MLVLLGGVVQNNECGFVRLLCACVGMIDMQIWRRGEEKVNVMSDSRISNGTSRYEPASGGRRGKSDRPNDDHPNR